MKYRWATVFHNKSKPEKSRPTLGS